MKSIGKRAAGMRIVACALAAMLVVSVAGGICAAQPFRQARRDYDPFQPAISQLGDIDSALVSVLKQQPTSRNSREIAAELNALQFLTNMEEMQVDFLLAREPVPLSADATADLLDVLAAAGAIEQEAENGLALYEDDYGAPQDCVNALSGVADSAQNLFNVVENSIGLVPT